MPFLILARASLPPSVNIFTNREVETQARVLNLRRLAFVLFAAKRDQYLLQLPGVQELLVDILRSNAVPLVQSEAFLCLRVVIYRYSSRELTNIWPVILSELVSHVLKSSPLMIFGATNWSTC